MVVFNRFEGYSNFETYNVATTILNSLSLRHIASQCSSYSEFCKHMLNFDNTYIAVQTPNGVPWNSPKLDVQALDCLFVVTHYKIKKAS